MWQEEFDPEAQDLVDHQLWPGPLNGHDAAKPEQLSKWISNKKIFKLITTRWAVPKMQKFLSDYSVVCYDWTKRAAKDSPTFRTAAAAEQIAPRVFSADRDGVYHPLAAHLRTIVNGFGQRDERRQRQEIQRWINDPAATMVKNQEDCDVLTQHTSLSHEEFTYVTELVQVFDRARCYWVNLILNPDINKLVNSRKLKAKNENTVYQWTQVQETMLKELTDVQASIKIIKSLLRIRKKRTKAVLWIAMKMADRPCLDGATSCSRRSSRLYHV